MRLLKCGRTFLAVMVAGYTTILLCLLAVMSQEQSIGEIVERVWHNSADFVLVPIYFVLGWL